MFEKKATQKQLVSMFDDIQNELSGMDKELENLRAHRVYMDKELQTHLTRFTELKAWVIQFCTEMKDKPADLTQIQNRINDMEGKQKQLDLLFTEVKPTASGEKKVLTKTARDIIRQRRNVKQ
jgi:DNA repair ATPase RecN